MIFTVAASLFSVNLAVLRDNPAYRVRTNSAGSAIAERRTGIDKRAVSHPVRLHALGVGGDSVINTKYHGGVDQAVYAYAMSDIEFWQQELSSELRFELYPGCLGENLTTAGLEVSEAVIGEQWQIGEALLEVSVPRMPCSTLAGFWQVDRLVKRFTAQARPGAYLRVLSEGEVAAGDAITIVHRPEHGLTIRETFRAMSGDRSLASKVLLAPQLPASVHAAAKKWLVATAP